MGRVTAADRAESIETLRRWLRPGDTVTTVLRHVSGSGMYRAIDLYALSCENGRPSRTWLSYHAARAGVGRWDDRREALGVSGAGMDMGFHAVYTLGYILWPDGYRCPGRKRCHEPYASHPTDASWGRMRHGSKGRGSGYALRQEWL